MKWSKLFLALICIPLYAELDLTLPPLSNKEIIELKEKFKVEDKKFLQFNYYREPPTKAQMITFWTLNTLDVITTYEGLKALPNAVEKNPFYPDRPSLGQLIIGKAIFGSLVGNNYSKKPMYYINTQLGLVVVHNYLQYN